MTGRRPIPGSFYRHFKGNLYQVITIATHAGTLEEMVVYQALYGDFKTYVRPLDMFMSDVDFKKYPNATQKLRFEPIDIADFRRMEEEKKKNLKETEKVSITKPQTVRMDGGEESLESVNPKLLAFLDAETYKERLEILEHMQDEISEKLLNDIAAVMDVSLGTGTLDEQYANLKHALYTFAKFERLQD